MKYTGGLWLILERLTHTPSNQENLWLTSTAKMHFCNDCNKTFQLITWLFLFLLKVYKGLRKGSAYFLSCIIILFII